MPEACSCDQAIHCMDFIQAMQIALDDAREQLGAVDHAGHADGEFCNCNMPETCGPVAWKILHAWADAVHDQICSTCGGFAREAATAVHDMVNAELGKPVQDPENLARFCGRVRTIEATQPVPPGSVIASIEEQLGVVSAAQVVPTNEPRRMRRRKIQLEALNGPQDQIWPTAHAGRTEADGRQAVRSRRVQDRCAPRAGRSFLEGLRRDEGGGKAGLFGYSATAKRVANVKQQTPLVLDTSVLSAMLIPRDPLWPIYREFLQGQEVTVNLMAIGEVLVAVNRLDAHEREDAKASLAALPRLELREEVAESYAVLRREAPRQVSQNDTWMAAFALAYDYPLVSDDRGLAAFDGVEIDGRTLHVFSRFNGNIGTGHVPARQACEDLDPMFSASMPRRIRSRQGIAQQLAQGIVGGIGFGLGGLVAHRVARAAAGSGVLQPAPSGGQDPPREPAESSQTAALTPDAQFEDADRLAADADRLLAEGDIRDAAEKAWGATVAAGRAFAIYQEGPSEDLRISTAVRRAMVRAAGQAGRESRQRQILTVYNDRQLILHGDCFYLGECTEGPLVEVMIRETPDFIASMRDLVSGAGA